MIVRKKKPETMYSSITQLFLGRGDVKSTPGTLYVSIIGASSPSRTCIIPTPSNADRIMPHASRSSQTVEQSVSKYTFRIQ